ncbi:hypothetical protein E2542_SST15211 [Spatholobus suberectus]|nr:hypothetical protein E2542_SST15211 [Spatholobus suberectus]
MGPARNVSHKLEQHLRLASLPVPNIRTMAVAKGGGGSRRGGATVTPRSAVNCTVAARAFTVARKTATAARW